MEKKPTKKLVYLWDSRKFKKLMWTYFWVYVALRAARATLYLTLGIAYLSTIPAAFIIFGTGMVWGFAILTVIIYRRSATPDPGVELEKECPTQR